MKQEFTESNLIFIISQPRAGSTLLQKIVSNNAEVATASEPWVLFPFALFKRPDLYRASYDEQVANAAFEEFISKFDGNDELNFSLKTSILSLYSKAIGNSRYFLDKTPRYYEILPQLMSWFPKARYIILKRNPLAVLASMIDTWSGGQIDYRYLLSFERDFLLAPKIIQEFTSNYVKFENLYQVQYESLVCQPDEEAKRLYNWLGLKFNNEVLEIEGNNKVKGRFGDDVYDVDRDIKYEKKPVKESANKWLKKLEDQNLKSFMAGYYQYLGKEFINEYGYDINSNLESSLQFKTTSFDHFNFLKANRQQLNRNLMPLLKYRLLRLFKFRI